jgi:hypothetical protein
MRNLLLLLIILFLPPGLKAQQLYCDFEGNKIIYFGDCTGKLDTLFNNPSESEIDSSRHCAKYIRDTSLYDNIRIYTNAKIENLESYANNSPDAAKIKMKLYSEAPVGTLIKLQLGSSLNNNYPGGIHSEYISYTTAKNAWENLSFSYLQSPAGGLTSSGSLDKLIILFQPGTNATDTFYFDDLIGPTLVTASSPGEAPASFKLFQNSPNPAKEHTHINIQLNTSGYVSLKVVDMIGNPVITLLDQNMKAGNYSIPVETSEIPDGIYFYILKKDGVSRSKKLIISK